MSDRQPGVLSDHEKACLMAGGSISDCHYFRSEQSKKPIPIQRKKKRGHDLKNHNRLTTEEGKST